MLGTTHVDARDAPNQPQAPSGGIPSASGAKPSTAARASPGWPPLRISLWPLLGLPLLAAYIYVPRIFYVETDDAYVQADAVTIETQLSRIRSGEAVKISVDALRGATLRGHVDSVQRGTGSYFALLPPENATGNFVKIIQRVPVKILLDSSNKAMVPLSPGMSVEVSVVARPIPNLLAGIFSD